MGADAPPSGSRGVTRRRSRGLAWLRRVGLLALAIACARIIIELVGSIDWRAVRGGVEHLEAWQIALLVAMVVLRQIFNAMPLVFFIDRLSVFRATASSQGSTLMSMIAPPTTDTVFRIAVMRSWGVGLDEAAAGSTCNVLAFYMARWSSPALGVLVLAGTRFEFRYAVTAVVSLLIAVAILVAALLVTRSQPLAARLGRGAGVTVGRLRNSVDPEVWASSVAGFQAHVADRFRRGLARSLPALAVMLLLDGAVLLLAIRFVGISQQQLSWVEVMAAFLVAFPLTLFPLQGLAVLDATLVAELTSVGGVDLEAALVAALVTYRVVALGTPAVLGALFVVGWRHTQRKADPLRDIDPSTAGSRGPDTTS